MDGTGLERNATTSDTASTSVNFQKPGGAKCGTLGASSEINVGLAMVIDAWPGLSSEARAEILAIVEAAGKADGFGGAGHELQETYESGRWSHRCP